MSYEGLTGKRKLFVDYYLGQANFNKSKAARMAGYPNPGVQGHRLSKEPEIRAAIDERLQEIALGQAEVLARLAEQARADMGDFIEVNEEGWFRINLTEAEQAGKLRLIKKVGYDPKGRPYVELHDAQGALAQLVKALGMAVQRREISGPDGGPLRVGISYEEALAELRARDAESGAEEDGGSEALPAGVIGL